MHPNLDGSTWLGQGGALKVFWKGFGSAMMLGGFFCDLIFQNFCSRRVSLINSVNGFDINLFSNETIKNKKVEPIPWRTKIKFI